MKTIIAATLALAVASPVLANDQLARSLGVEPGQYSLQELVILKAHADESGNDGRVTLSGDKSYAGQANFNSVAQEHFRIAEEQEDD